MAHGGVATRAGAWLLAGTATLALGACGSAKSSGSAQPLSASSGTGSGSVFAPARGAALKAADVVLKATDAPPGSSYLKGASGPLSLDALVQGDNNAAAEKRALEQSGFQGAYRALYAGVALPAAINQAHLIASFALAFPSSSAAHAALPVVATLAQRTGAAAASIAPTGLGAGAIGLRSPLNSIPGSSYFYAWPFRNTVRVLVDSGTSRIVDAQSTLALARRIQAQTTAATVTRASDLVKLVLAPSQAPTDTQLNARASGVKTVTNFARSPAGLQALRRLGFRGGYGNEFLSPALLKPPPATHQGNYVLSEAQQFATAKDAFKAYRFFRQRELRLFAGHPVQSLDTSGLGSAATGLSYVDAKKTGSVYGFGYFWQTGRFLLALFQVGSKGYATPTTAKSLASRMNQYAG